MLKIEILQSTDVDQGWWGRDYVLQYKKKLKPEKETGHILDSFLKENLFEYGVPKDRLVEWQKYLAMEQTCFKLASALSENGTLDTIKDMRNILLRHYNNLVHRRFPRSLSKEFKHTISAEGIY